MDLNKFGKRAFVNALKRGKITDCLTGEQLHQQTVESLKEEYLEVTNASETESSEHLSGYSEVVEEIADIAIVAMTELYRRGVDIETVLHSKMKYNEMR